jgi:hypothetical protein
MPPKKNSGRFAKGYKGTSNLDAERARHRATRAELEAVIAELKETWKQRCAQQVERERIVVERKQGRKITKLEEERDKAVRERDDAVAERDAAVVERDAAVQLRHAAIRERGEAQQCAQQAVRGRTIALSNYNELRDQHAALRAENLDSYAALKEAEKVKLAQLQLKLQALRVRIKSSQDESAQLKNEAELLRCARTHIYACMHTHTFAMRAHTHAYTHTHTRTHIYIHLQRAPLAVPGRAEESH